MSRIIFLQPALPKYRLDFFERLSSHYGDEFRVFYSPESLGLLTDGLHKPWSSRIGLLRALPFGLHWQFGVFSIPLRRGDVLVVAGNPRHLSTIVLIAKSKLKGVKIVWWGHYWSSTSKKWRHYLKHIPMRLASGLMFYTCEEVERYRQTLIGRNDSRNIAGLNNGLDLQPIEQNRRPYYARKREREIFFIGRVTKKSRLSLLLDAVSKLGSAAPHVHIVGDGDEAASLKAFALSLGIQNFIEWHGASVDERIIASIANRCAMFVYPGEVGLSLIHAMAYGLPAIVHSNKLRHMPEIAAFRDGQTGLTFTDGDSFALAKAISSALASPESLDYWSSSALEIVGPSFSTEDMARRARILLGQVSQKIA